MGSLVDAINKQYAHRSSGLIDSLRRHRKDFLIAGIFLQMTTQQEYDMYTTEELAKKSIKELTAIHNKLVAKNERKAAFRSKDAAIEAVTAAQTKASEAGATEQPAKPASAKANGKGKKAAAAAASAAAEELGKSSAKPADNTCYKAVQGQFRMNEGSARHAVYNELLTSGGKNGMTLAELSEALPKTKGIAGALRVLVTRKQVAAA